MKNATNSLVNIILSLNFCFKLTEFGSVVIQGKTFDQIDWTNCIPTNDIPVVRFKSYFEQLVS